jgi:hypothetical protein
MRRQFISTFAFVGLIVAVLFAAVRLYLIHNPAADQNLIYGGWFDSVTLILWPPSFYLTILMKKEPLSTQFIVWSIAILANPILYALLGWLAWRIAKVMRWVGP